MYGLFDGFHGSGVADFAQKRIPAELLLGQLSQNSDDETVKEALRQAFLNVDREYFESIMEAIMSRCMLPLLLSTVFNDKKKPVMSIRKCRFLCISHAFQDGAETRLPFEAGRPDVAAS